jgi:hypothetical protein
MRNIVARRVFTKMIICAIAAQLTIAVAAAQAPGYAEILSPRGGEAIRGVFTIEGTASHPAFASYQLSFAYALDDLQTWFLLGEPQSNPVDESGLGLWDTNGISDGEYNLRLEVFLTNGNSIVSIVEGIRVRNTTPIEPPTAAPQEIESLTSPATPTATPTPRPTPLPPLNQDPTARVEVAFIAGVTVGAILLISLGIYLALRRNAQKRWSMLQMRQLHRDQERKQTRKGRR